MKDHEVIDKLRDINPVPATETREWGRSVPGQAAFRTIQTRTARRSLRDGSHRLVGRPALVGISILVLLVGVAAGYVVSRPTTNPLSAGCYRELDQASDTAIVSVTNSSADLSPAGKCASLWQAAFGETAPVNLVTCVVTGGGLGVFPAESNQQPEAACGAIGASVPEEGNYAGASAERVRQWAADLEERYTLVSDCIGGRDLHGLIQESLQDWEFEQWRVEDLESGSKNLQCASYSIDATAGIVFVVYDH